MFGIFGVLLVAGRLQLTLNLGGRSTGEDGGEERNPL